MKNNGNDNEVRVLVAEDNEVNQKVIRAILERRGYSLEFAKDGSEACEKFTREKYNVVLMDCQMPVLDGLQAATMIRARERQSNSERVPIIALTANAMSGDRQRCFTAGMDDFLSKPFKSGELVEKIVQWTRSNK